MWEKHWASENSPARAGGNGEPWVRQVCSGVASLPTRTLSLRFSDDFYVLQDLLGFRTPQISATRTYIYILMYPAHRSQYVGQSKPTKLGPDPDLLAPTSCAFLNDLSSWLCDLDIVLQTFPRRQFLYLKLELNPGDY